MLSCSGWRPWLTLWLVLTGISAGFAATTTPVSNFLRLKPDKSIVADGATVTFTIGLEKPFNDPRYVCQVEYGDTTHEIWNRSGTLSHTYHHTQEAAFEARVLVGNFNKAGAFFATAQSPSVRIFVQPPPPPPPDETKPSEETKPSDGTKPRAPVRLTLRAAQKSAWVDEPVTFLVELTGYPAATAGRIGGGAKAPGFDFNPGDGTGAVHETDTKFTYPYRRGDTFAPSIVLTGTDISGETQVVIRPKPQVSLSVPTAPLQINQPGRFEAVLNPASPELGYIFHFDGDAAGVPSQNAVISHPFAESGRHTAYVEVGRLVKGRTGATLSPQLGRSQDMDVRVGEPPQIQLSPTSFTAQEGETVWFTVSMSDGSDPGGFRFDPGEKWEGSSQIMRGPRFPYQYQHRGSYRATVSINGSAGVTSIVTVSARPPPVPPWLIAVASLLVLGAAAGFAKAGHFFPFRPSVSFQPVPDKRPELRPGKQSPAVSFALRLKPNSAARQGQVRTLPPPLIKTKTKLHD